MAYVTRASSVISTQEENSSDISLHGGITAEVWSEEECDINIQAARDELSQRVINWALSFVNYEVTRKIVIRSIASLSEE